MKTWFITNCSRRPIDADVHVDNANIFSVSRGEKALNVTFIRFRLSMHAWTLYDCTVHTAGIWANTTWSFPHFLTSRACYNVLRFSDVPTAFSAKQMWRVLRKADCMLEHLASCTKYNYSYEYVKYPIPTLIIIIIINVKTFSLASVRQCGNQQKVSFNGVLCGTRFSNPVEKLKLKRPNLGYDLLILASVWAIVGAAQCLFTRPHEVRLRLPQTHLIEYECVSNI